MYKYIVLSCALAACQVPESKVPQAAKQPTLWNLCYNEDGSPIIYEMPQKEYACKSPSRLKWPSLPVQVHLDESVLDATESFLWAFAAWEEWLGRPVFELTPESGDWVVEAFQGDSVIAEEFGIAAMAPHEKRSDGTIEAIVVFFSQYRFNTEVVAHEFGHTLGLAHDKDDKRSIMYPSMRTQIPRLQAEDRAVLCALYGCGG